MFIKYFNLFHIKFGKITELKTCNCTTHWRSSPIAMTLCRCWMACRRGMGVLCDTVGTHHRFFLDFLRIFDCFLFLVSCRANMWLNVDCCGLFCGIVTQGFIVFGMYSTSFAVIFPWMGISVFSILLCCLHSFLCVMAMISHIQTMTTNPGAVPREACPLSDDEEERDYEAGKNKLPFKKYCRKCQSFKPSRAHHCSMCGRCIVKVRFFYLIFSFYRIFSPFPL